MTQAFYSTFSAELKEGFKEMEVFSEADINQAYANSVKHIPVKAFNFTEDLGLIKVIGFVSYFVDEEFTESNHYNDFELSIDLASPDGEEQLEEGIAKCREWYQEPIIFKRR